MNTLKLQKNSYVGYFWVPHVNKYLMLVQSGHCFTTAPTSKKAQTSFLTFWNRANIADSVAAVASYLLRHERFYGALPTDCEHVRHPQVQGNKPRSIRNHFLPIPLWSHVRRYRPRRRLVLAFPLHGQELPPVEGRKKPVGAIVAT